MRNVTKRAWVSFAMLAAIAVFSLAVSAAYGNARRGSAFADGSGPGDTRRSVDLPILMYHSLLNDPSRQNDYVLSPEVFEQDLLYLRDNGYTAISADELADYVYDGAPLPDKPVMITFDDAHLNTLTYGLPLLEKYDMRAVVSVIGEFTEQSSAEDDHNPNYSYLTWEEVKAIEATGRFEIGNHTYDMHKGKGARRGIAKKRGEDEKSYTDAVSLDILKLQDALERYSGVRPTVFAYPFGEICEESKPLIKQLGFRMSFSCTEKINRIDQYDTGCLYCLGRFNRPSFISTADFMKRCGI